MPILCNLGHRYDVYVHGGVPFLFCRQCGFVKIVNVKRLIEEDEKEGRRC